MKPEKYAMVRGARNADAGDDFSSHAHPGIPSRRSWGSVVFWPTGIHGYESHRAKRLKTIQRSLSQSHAPNQCWCCERDLPKCDACVVVYRRCRVPVLWACCGHHATP